MSATLVSVLAGAGRGFAMLGTLEQKTTQAYAHVGAAQTALAAADFSKSDQEFGSAQRLLGAAREELDAALASSKIILTYADVTGTVRSGTELLQAGEALMVAGQHVTRGITTLLQTRALEPTEGTEETMVDVLQRAFAEFSAAEEALARAEQSLAAVDSPLLPPHIATQAAQLKVAVPRAHEALATFLEKEKLILEVLGATRSREYLLLFENNDELRPTGGFIGSIALVHVDRGVVEDINVQSVYDPDGQLKEYIAPPEPLRAITDRWYMRDANWFVEYETSAKKIAGFFEKEGGSTIDGVIAMTPEVIQELLRVTGPIEMPAYDVTVTADNFVILAQDQVTYAYDRELNRPKQFLADLAPQLLQRVFNTKAEETLHVLGALHRLIQEKHLLVYFSDDALQQQIREAGWSGSFPESAQGFLAVNTANIGGHKSDQFVEQEIDYRSEIQRNGDVEVVVTIRRSHKGPDEAIEYEYPPGEDPAFKDNVVYQRVLVPTAAELLEARGFTPAADIPQHVVADPDIELTADNDVVEWQRQQTIHTSGTSVGHEAGYQYFGNWIITPPGATTVVLYRYRVPQHAILPSLLAGAQRYSTYIAKQPGDTRTTLRVEVTLPETLKIVHTVPDDGVTQLDARTLAYRGALRQDTFVGAVVTGE